MEKQGTRVNKNKDVDGGRYARTDEALYKKAIGILDKCRIDTRD